MEHFGRHSNHRSNMCFYYIYPPLAALFLHALIGQMRKAQIEFAFDPTPRLVFQLTAPVKLVDCVSFSGDQQKFDFLG